MPNNSDRKFDKILEGIQYIIGDNRRLREDLGEYARQAAEDRKQAAMDREQAAEDRREMKELIRGIRQALVIIGKRGGEFVEIQKQQGAQIKKLTELTEKMTELTEKNTNILQGIHKTLRAQRNGKSGNGRPRA